MTNPDSRQLINGAGDDGSSVPAQCDCFTYGPYDWYVCADCKAKGLFAGAPAEANQSPKDLGSATGSQAELYTVEAVSVSKPPANTTIRVPCDCHLGSHSSMGDQWRCWRLRKLEAAAREMADCLHRSMRSDELLDLPYDEDAAAALRSYEAAGGA